LKLALESTVDYVLKRAQIIRRIAQAWLLLLIVGSLQPSRPGAVLAHHRGLHFLSFGGVALLLLLLARTRYQEIRAVLGVCLLGLSLEYMQHLLYRNPMEWWDVRDDTLAVLAAFALYRLAVICRTVFGATS
jgi:hypothetical protein